jgi:hypothetical protein
MTFRPKNGDVDLERRVRHDLAFLFEEHSATINLSSRPERNGVEGPCVFKRPVLCTQDFLGHHTRYFSALFV